MPNTGYVARAIALPAALALSILMWLAIIWAITGLLS